MHGLMKAFLQLLAVCLLLVTSTSCQVFNRWRGPCSMFPMPEPEGGTPVAENFASAEGRFRIGLPGRTAASTEAETDSKTFNWVIINQGQFQIFYLDRERAVDTPGFSETLLNKFRDDASSRGKLVKESQITLSGHPGREFRLDRNASTVIERVYLAGNRIYVVAVLVPQNLSCKVGSAVKVLDTFEITE